ncbi:GNAT family N-acetyltransferase [Streptomyces sp. NBC_01016]|uniref:GNAT family N-acetyltransferase n=1 Tax=Streptomyces sp. NBC_01016 TaxID=2903720 RepID=UPI002253BB2C|nr:GNAT family N-acetyltransferase [Streptomyces sp. NBC_01016]MCX4831134.1 GNAT family N-acetyltransferase [Streptomyces sp. NBC_01016]
MAIELVTPEVDELGDVVDVLRTWQHDTAPMQLHPGDLGWYWRTGAERTAADVRTWRRGGRVLAVGLLDGPTLLRLTLAPDAHQDPELARQLLADVGEPKRGVLPEGPVDIEAPRGVLLHDLLAGAGWRPGEAWTPLRRDLTEPVRSPAVRIEVAGPDRADAYAAVHRAAFDGSTFSEARWHAMAAGAPYAEARCLLAYDDEGAAVAAVTVWSAGPGRPGLLEPMGVHRDHRGRGHGAAISVAAAAALRELGASSALVGTPSANTAAVATYKAVGFQPLPEVRDRCREA